MLLQFYLIILIVFADLSESKIYLVRDYDDAPIYSNKAKGIVSRSPHFSKSKLLGNSKYLKSKRGKHTRQAVLQYGRHIYHLDSFEDLTKLRSPKADISYDYFDVKDLKRSKAIQRNIPWDYIEDVVFLSQKPIKKKCNGKTCEENSRKYAKLYHKHKKYKENDYDYGERNKLHGRSIKRFKIIDNSKAKESRERYESSEEKTHKRKRKQYKRKKKYPSSSSEEETKSNLASDSAEKWDKKKKKFYESTSSSEGGSIYIKNKHTAITDSKSTESVVDSGSNSIEKTYQMLKQKKKQRKSEKHKRETYLQGNKLITDVDSEEGDMDKRRRLPQFLPKRYHWNPEDIHDLGYYWFNGPKGKYPDPTSLT